MKRWDTWLAGVFLGLIVWLMWDRLAEIDWREVRSGLTSTPWYILLVTAFLTVISYAIYVTFDRLGLSVSGQRLAKRASWTAAFVCYAANFNLGSIVGGVGMRLKLYTDLGIDKAHIGRLIALSTLSNWAGYALFAGIFFLIGPPIVTAEYGLDGVPWRWVGAVGLVLVGGYVFVIRSGRESITVFSHEIPLPSQREGLARLALGVANWLSVSTLLVVIFSWYMQAPLALVVGSYLVAAIAGVITHIPGGLGVFESIFLASLGPMLGNADVLVGVLTFRAIYYLIPLLIALPVFAWLKWQLVPEQKNSNKKKVKSSTVPQEQPT